MHFVDQGNQGFYGGTLDEPLAKFTQEILFNSTNGPGHLLKLN